jgi:hypothetical protein
VKSPYDQTYNGTELYSNSMPATAINTFYTFLTNTPAAFPNMLADQSGKETLYYGSYAGYGSHLIWMPGQFWYSALNSASSGSGFLFSLQECIPPGQTQPLQYGLGPFPPQPQVYPAQQSAQCTVSAVQATLYPTVIQSDYTQSPMMSVVAQSQGPFWPTLNTPNCFLYVQTGFTRSQVSSLSSSMFQPATPYNCYSVTAAGAQYAAPSCAQLSGMATGPGPGDVAPAEIFWWDDGSGPSPNSRYWPPANQCSQLSMPSTLGLPNPGSGASCRYTSAFYAAECTLSSGSSTGGYTEVVLSQ